MQQHPQNHAFSLVELSIVLVILGLLVGGILSGQSLIRAAELRSVATEYNRYFTAAQSFRDKYFAIPGDFNNAVAFWGAATANGNGDGSIDVGAGANVTAEAFQLWNQLALAGLIEGSYTGLAGPSGNTDVRVGTNAPRSKMTNAGWALQNAPNYAGDTGVFAADLKNSLIIGGANPGFYPLGSLLKPEEAWNIDTKIDDGKPGTGKILTRSNGAAWGTPTACSLAASNTDYAGGYNLVSSTVICTLYFARSF